MGAVKRSRQDALFDFFNYVLMTLAMLVVLYPLYFILIASISSSDAVNTGQVWLWPKGFTLEGYERIYRAKSIWMGYRNAIGYTIVGTAINLALTLTAAYALSAKKFFGKNMIMRFLVITMFFHGGIIPTYLIIKSLGLLNKALVMVVHEAAQVWFIIIARTYYQSTVPEELREAAIMDGCNHVRTFLKVVLPLSHALVAVLILYYGIGHWNQYFKALIYLRDENLYPLQLVLRKILVAAEIDEEAIEYMAAMEEQMRLYDIMKYGCIVVASLPLLVLYPFLQRSFVKGIMIGSVKG